MGMKYMQFVPCPECTESRSPNIYHTAAYAIGGNPEIQTFQARCQTCGYETKHYDHVIDLVKAWNADSFKAWPSHSKEK